MGNINLKELSAAQRAQLIEQLKEQNKAEEERQRKEREAYKTLASECVDTCFGKIRDISESLARSKQEIVEAFRAVIDIKDSVYGVKEGRQSHTFINHECTRRIKIGYNVLDVYDDTAATGEAIIKEYLQGVAKASQDAKVTADMCLELLSRDSKGNLKPQSIMRLRKHAIESGNARFLEGVDIIMAAHSVTFSKQYLKAEEKDSSGQWRAVPLGMTEA